MAKDKISTFLGFCIRARKIVFGAGSVEVQRGGVYLVVVCSTAAPNTFKAAVKFSGRFKCSLMICRCGLEEAVHRPGCKIAAVKDKNLADAIIANACEEYEIYAGGVQG